MGANYSKARFLLICIFWRAFVLALPLGMTGKVAGADAQLSWNPSSSTNIAGYTVYCGAASNNYTNHFDARNQTNAIVTGLTVGANYYFVVTAYSADGRESPPSNEATYTVSQAATNQNTAPGISGFTVGSQTATLVWSSISGRSYLVLCKTNLNDPQWTSLSPVLPAASSSLQWADTNAASSSQKFYLIKLLQ